MGTHGLQGAEPVAPVRFRQLGVPAGLYQYVSGAWGVVGVEIVNAEDQPVDVLAACAFSPDPDIQFARRVGLPPRTKRRTWIPVQLPKISPDRESIPCFGLLIDDRSGREVVLRREQEGVQHTGLLRVNHDRPLSGFFSDETKQVRWGEVDYAYEAAIAYRTSRGFQRRMVPIQVRDLPPLPELLDGLDQIVLWNDRFASDVAILGPLRKWLHNGGELWVMLDRVELVNVEKLLGQAFTCQLVDRVELHEVTIRDEQSDHSATSTVAYEQPVNFVRVLVDDMHVTHTVDGWPAAFECSVGRGRALFTALDARAWIEEPRMARPYWDTTRMSDYWPNEHLDSLTLLQNDRPPLGQPSMFRDYLFERIGYRIASRSSVTTLLGLFCGALLLAGVGLAWRRRLEHFAWIAPLLAVAATIPLAALGLQAQRAVPATVGQAQLLEVSDGADQVLASGLLAFYDPAMTQPVCGALRGGVFQPEENAMGGTMRRMVWSDLDRWHWDNLRPTAGLWTADFQWSDDLNQRLAVQGTFSEQGFVARWVDQPLPLTDIVIALPGQPCLAMREDRTELVAGPGDVLPPGRYVGSGWLSDEQRRRQVALAKMLGPSSASRQHVQRPLLLGWGDPLELDFQFPASAQPVGTALWAIPLKIQPARPGTSVVIPSPFVELRVTSMVDGQGASPLYDHRRGQWIASKSASEVWLHFQVPAAVLPLDVDRVRLTLQMTAPGRTIEIRCMRDQQIQQLARIQNPIGVIAVPLSGDSLPPMETQGRLTIGLVISGIQDQTGTVAEQLWEIERVQLEIAGKVGSGLDL
ncbi:MAG: hypothetical protein EA424_11440 [Planctomycetaceae bacterium]|nr:MAG: hypothetical protein EA424_11440 [Planctomycetaceae bacterium]